ncbi:MULTISPECIES: hypothetical protein [Chryseobacterium]|uniref:Uncharacterized protein n=1 Tax=Chryseobacterium geocarposphaerae TaxID=1416776 RepID=A0ABU1L9V1_9FLAO|nr:MULTISPECIES: hypothetical protein [Chryseobacterium]MDR6403487.1 hypothetical protein [Chryseobacterium geocarposphaerae]MDR6697041.1 hypothetical protein [Chryseobacterium ginsenosidimutans]
MNNKFDDKIVEKIITDTRYFVIFVLIVASMFGLVLQKCTKDSNESQMLLTSLRKTLEYQKYAVIINKGINSENRNIPYIVFSDKEQLDIGDNFYKLIEEGDSISKKRSTTIYYIYRNKQIFKYDYLEDYLGNYNE